MHCSHPEVLALRSSGGWTVAEVGRSMIRFIQIIAVGALIALVPSCTTSKPEAQQSLVTASAMIAALPLIPVALPFHIVREVNERKAEKQLQDVLDPVYQSRITLIEKRDPVATRERHG
jgi:hypothetical protein